MNTSNKPSTKTFLISAAILFSLLFYIFMIHDILLFDWRVKYSEERVQKSIVANYINKKDAFAELVLYSNNLSEVQELEFFQANQIKIYLHKNLSPATYMLGDLSTFEHNGNEISIQEDGLARVKFQDSIIHFQNWFWDFQGDKDHPNFKEVLHFSGISETQLDSLQLLLRKTNCEAISIFPNGDIKLRYDGFSMCEYVYQIIKEENNLPSNYQRIEEKIYCGLNRSELYCGQMIFSK